jgi:uncharacterized protein (TIGR03435 family)
MKRYEVGLRFQRVALVLAIAVGVQLRGQTLAQTHPAISDLQFEVASVRENRGTGDGRSHIYSSSHDPSFRTQNVSLKTLLQFAFDIPDSRLVGVPSAFEAARFDIDAKAEGLRDEIKNVSDDEGKAQKRQMVQALLVERFGLKVHREKRELPIYSLVVAKGGAKLKPTKQGGQLVNGYYGRLQAEGLTSEALARELAKATGRVVLDKTGLDGRFDVTLRWTPDEGPAMLNGAPVPDPPPSIFTAVQEQLGLKLEPGKGPVDVLVIDHVEMPTEN